MLGHLFKPTFNVDLTSAILENAGREMTLPGGLVLDIPQGVKPHTTDGSGVVGVTFQSEGEIPEIRTKRGWVKAPVAGITITINKISVALIGAPDITATINWT